MKNRLIKLGVMLLFCLPGFAQPGGPPTGPGKLPTVILRAGNQNTLDFFVSAGGTLLTPTSSQSISVEVRLTDVGRIITKVPLSTVDPVDGSITGPLPTNLEQGTYQLSLVIERPGIALDRDGIGYLQLIAPGSLQNAAAAGGMTVIIDRAKRIVDARLDAGPTQSIARYYANKAQAYADSAALKSGQAVAAGLSDVQNQITTKLNKSDTTVFVRKNTYANNRFADQQIVAGKLNITDSSAFVRKVNGLRLTSNDYTTAEKNKLSGIATGATNVDSTQLVRKAAYTGNRDVDRLTVTNHINDTSNPHGVTKAQVGLGSARNVASYSQTESDAAKPDITTVSTFALAQTQVAAGKPKVFIITADETYGSSLTIWNGTSYTVLPLIPRTN